MYRHNKQDASSVNIPSQNTFSWVGEDRNRSPRNNASSGGFNGYINPWIAGSVHNGPWHHQLNRQNQQNQQNPFQMSWGNQIWN